MKNLALISLIGSTGFPIAITAYLLIRLEKQLTSLSNSINTLNTIVSVKLGAVVKMKKTKQHNIKNLIGQKFIRFFYILLLTFDFFFLNHIY